MTERNGYANGPAGIGQTFQKRPRFVGTQEIGFHMYKLCRRGAMEGGGRELETPVCWNGRRGCEGVGKRGTSIRRGCEGGGT